MSTRGETIDPYTVGVYHVWCRCVRRAWLCGGEDPETGKNYDHRRKWWEDRLALQATLFGMEVCFVAGMMNHGHNVLRNRPDVVCTWSDEEVVYRNLLINQLPRCFDGELRIPSAAEVKIEMALASEDKMAEYRLRLHDISWFMKQQNEYMARHANHEDDTTGRFWEGPYGCRRLEDTPAIVSCGIYLDLNQTRAGEAETPEESEHTSAYFRIQGAKYLADFKYHLNLETPFDIDKLDEMNAAATRGESNGETTTEEVSEQVVGALPEGEATVVRPSREEATDQAATETPQQRLDRFYRERPDGWLVELTLQEGLDVDVTDGVKPSKFPRLTDKGLLPMKLTEYLELLDYTGRAQVSGKRGAIPAHLASILERLHINADHWFDTIKDFEKLFGRSVGRVPALVERAKASGRGWIRGGRNCAAAFT